eukprot:5715493-Amphidinium_carterae.1
MDSEEHLVGCRTAGVVRCRTRHTLGREGQVGHASPNDGRITTSYSSNGVSHEGHGRKSGCNGSSTRGQWSSGLYGSAYG